MMRDYYDYIVIGGGIAGVTAAETIRGKDSGGSIGIFSGESHPLYSRVLLPAYLNGRISRERVFLRTLADYAAKNIDIHSGATVTALDALRREIKTADGATFGFGKLLIASGGSVKPWEHDEAARNRSYRLQTIDDADRLMADLADMREPLVIGSSFIALEFIEIFLQHKIIPRVLTSSPRFFAAFADDEGAGILEENAKRRGVACMFDDRITGFGARDSEFEIQTLRSGAHTADAFAIGIGIERNLGFARGSVALGARGIRTNEYLETSADGVYAAGDIAEYYDQSSCDYRTAGNWTHALMQGTRAGLNMAGERAPFTHIPSYAISALGMQIVAIGECSPHFSSIARADRDLGSYERFFIRDGILMGAFLINRSSDRAYLTDLIRCRADIRQWKKELADPLFDIRAVARVE